MRWYGKIVHSVYFKTILLFSSFELALILVCVQITAQIDREQRKGSLQESAIHLLELIDHLLVDHMLYDMGNRDRLNNDIELFSTIYPENNITITAPDGRVKFSNDRRIIDRLFQHRNGQTCIGCKRPFDRQPALEKDLVISGETGLHLVRAIGRQNSCLRCHSEDPIGYLSLHIGMEERKKDSPPMTNIVTLLYIAAAGLSVLALALLLYYVFLRPLYGLRREFIRLQSGEFGTAETVFGKDEIGMLFVNFKEMKESLARLYAEMQQTIDRKTEGLRNFYNQLREMQSRFSELERLSTAAVIAAGVAHEIRTPLNSLAINFQILCKKWLGAVGDDEAMRLHTRLIDSEITRINTVLESFLDQVKTSTKKHTRVFLKSLFEKVRLLTDHEIEKHGVTFTLNLEGDLAVFASEDQLVQVFLNLIFNSLQACHREKSLTIGVFAKSKDEDTVEIRFNDDGTGIAREHRTKIFRPFFTTKAEGTGMGLAVIKRIISDHGGTIVLDIENETGTTFIIGLHKFHE